MVDNGAAKKLEELEKRVVEDYMREADASSHYERSACSLTLSVKDLFQLKNSNNNENGSTTARPPTTRLEVLHGWRDLVTVMRRDHVFVEYSTSLLRAYKELRVIDPSLYRHLRTLVELLVNTAENKNRDNSTECRFVTLLEVMLSYGKEWKPSEEVSQFWVRLMQRIPEDVAAVNFRRKAYRILVSLSWVPSSKGLLAACSFEENRQSIDPEKVPASIRPYLEKIRGGRPQPRYDSVNQLLDRLKDETDVCVAITSEKEGAGKTTLAALVATHPSIRRVFSVLWLTMTTPPNNETTMTYERYTEYLDDLCEQLSIKLEWPECVQRFEEPALRRLREEMAIKEAKEKMSETLLAKDENVLLVMDDVVDSKQIDYFRFNERQSVILTTPESSLDGVDWTVELCPMSEDEAVELFLTEANLPESHVLGLTIETRNLVRQCGLDPLTVRTVGRWFSLKQVAAGIVNAMQELSKELSSLVEPDHMDSISENGDTTGLEEVGKQASSTLLHDVLSLMLRPARAEGSSNTSIFILCFASMVAVFLSKVPLDSILLLWEQVMKNDPDAVEELFKDDQGPSMPDSRKYGWFIVEGLIHMGLISVREDGDSAWIEIHHRLYRDCAIKLIDPAKSFDDAAEEWNKSFVTSYFTQMADSMGGKDDDPSWVYAIEKLPYHIFQAKMLPMAEIILGEEHFFRARVDAMGWERAVAFQIKDCVQLQKALEDERDDRQTVSPVFEKAATVIGTLAESVLGSSETDPIVEISRAVYKIGFALAENNHYSEAIEKFESAQNLLPQSQELRASILYGAGWTFLASNSSEKALKKIKACRKVMEEYASGHVLYMEALRLQAEAVVGECEYREAAELFEQAAEKLQSDAPGSKMELGTILNRKGRLYHMMGELEKAKESLDECLKLKLEIGECSRDLASAYSALGDISLEQRHVCEARQNYENAIEVLDNMKIGPEDKDHLLTTGKLRYLRSDFAGSLEVLDQARHAIINAPTLSMDQSAYDLRCIAKSYHSRGEIETAASVIQESLALTDERPFSLERSAGLLELGDCILGKEDVSEGLICMEQSLEIRILKLGECVQVLDTLSSIGNVHISLGAYEEALTVFEKVYELTERISPDDVERIAGVLYSIGEVHDGMKDYPEAIAKFEECMDVLKRDRSDDHPDIAKALQRLGDVTATMKDLDNAYDYYCEALRIRQMHVDQRQLAETLHSLGVLTRKRKQLEPALEPLLDALEIRRNGDNGRETGETLFELANVYRLQSKTDEAVSIYEKSLEVLEEKDDIRGSVYLALGHAKLSLHRDGEALICYQRSLDIRVAAYGKDNMKTGNVSRSLGIVKYLLDKGDEALVHLNEFVRVTEMGEDEDDEEEEEDLDYVLAIMLLFDLYKANGKDGQAKNLIEVAKEVCDENEELREEVPALVDMVNRRLPLADEASKGGILSRLNLEDEAGTHLIIDENEATFLRQIPFVDD